MSEFEQRASAARIGVAFKYNLSGESALLIIALLIGADWIF
jgi:hypothetical protein